MTALGTAALQGELVARGLFFAAEQGLTLIGFAEPAGCPELDVGGDELLLARDCAQLVSR